MLTTAPSVLLSSYRKGVPLALVTCIALASHPFLNFSLGGAGGYHDKQRFVEALCLSLAALLAVLRSVTSDRRPPLLDRKVAAALALFFSLGMLSSVLSFSPRHALHEASSFFLLLTLSGLIAGEVRRAGTRYFDALLIVCGIGCLFYLYHVALNYAAFVMNGVQPRHNFIIHGFDNFRFLNHAQTVSLPLICLLAVRHSHDRRLYWLWFVTAALWWSVVYLTSARGLMLGMLAGSIAAALFSREQAAAWIRLMIHTAAVGVLAYLALYTVLPLALGFEPFGFMASVVERTASNPTSSRIELWQLAWQLIREHPLLGAGPLHYAHAAVSLKNAAHPHNWVLQIAAEWGVPALLCIAMVIALAFRSLLRAGRAAARMDQTDREIAAAFVAIAVAVGVDGLVSGLIVMPTSQLWIALYFGCAWGWTASRSNVATTAFESTASAPVRIAIAAITVAMLYFYWNGLFPELADLQSYEEGALRQFGTMMYRPRIWLTGYF